MKILLRSVIPNQECSLCRTVYSIEPKDLLRDAISLNYAMWKCPLCKETQKVNWGENNET